MIFDIDVAVLAAGLFAGFVDAIAGGGGLVMIPALMLAGLPPFAAVATNKLCGTAGVVTSSLKFARERNVDWRAAGVMGVPAVLGSLLGSRSVGLLPHEQAEPVIVVLLIGITLFVIFKPELGTKRTEVTAGPPRSERLRVARLAVFGALIGFHDGFFGPGAGTFLLFVLISVRSLDFLKATGTAKVINLMTNATALAFFLSLGAVDFQKGIAGAVGVIVGSYAGATFATKKGARVIKPVFVCVTLVITGKLLLG